MALSSLTAPLFALFMSLGGFNWSYGSQTDTKGKAMVELTADENLSGVKVTIKGSDGTEVSKSINIKAGKSTKVTWTQKGRQVSYEIKIEANDAFTNGEFEVVRPVAGGTRGSLALQSDREEIVDDQKIRYKTPFTLSSHELQVFNTDGEMIVDDTVTDEIVEAGETFEMSWQTADEVFMIKVTGSDDTGYSATDTRVPWSVHIPHTEVNFDSGKYNIKGDEEWKVAEAFAVLVHELDNLERANKALDDLDPDNATSADDIKVQLYIVGYTDTVGNAADNKKLSENRARSIAQYFVDNGAWCEIHYAGMGEKGLAVDTGDSVDEVRNRRALYILSPQKPAGGGQVPGGGSWKKLADARPRMMNNLPPLPESYTKYKEEQRQAREAKFGGGGYSGDGDDDGDLGDGGDDDGALGGSGSSGGDGGSGSSGASGSSSDGGPPSVGGEPGGTKQGCAVEDPATGTGLGLLASLFGLLGLRRRRRAS
ncbi:Outer membrane protein A precursor [Enhygromyxa salina]|uniref:Outer membrane protein A n=1 Tax=Enhygromyxa salina TaxID=215803 RepID=A0A2S9XCS8_9BACT|nr:OmpA family protein [Enhygromyxa salina]PRP90659.1 Outer membrane protein A precursor [Enhygromyxa salina]